MAGCPGGGAGEDSAKAALRGSGAAWQEEERLAKAVSAVRKPV